MSKKLATNAAVLRPLSTIDRSRNLEQSIGYIAMAMLWRKSAS